MSANNVVNTSGGDALSAPTTRKRPSSSDSVNSADSAASVLAGMSAQGGSDGGSTGDRGERGGSSASTSPRSKDEGGGIDAVASAAEVVGSTPQFDAGVPQSTNDDPFGADSPTVPVGPFGPGEQDSSDDSSSSHAKAQTILATQRSIVNKFYEVGCCSRRCTANVAMHDLLRRRLLAMQMNDTCRDSFVLGQLLTSHIIEDPAKIAASQHITASGRPRVRARRERNVFRYSADHTICRDLFLMMNATGVKRYRTLLGRLKARETANVDSILTKRAGNTLTRRAKPKRARTGLAGVPRSVKKAFDGSGGATLGSAPPFTPSPATAPTPVFNPAAANNGSGTFMGSPMPYNSMPATGGPMGASMQPYMQMAQAQQIHALQAFHAHMARAAQVQAQAQAHMGYGVPGMYQYKMASPFGVGLPAMQQPAPTGGAEDNVASSAQKHQPQQQPQQQQQQQQPQQQQQQQSTTVAASASAGQGVASQ